LTPQQQAVLRQQFQQQQRLGLAPQWREGAPNQQGPRAVLIQQGQQQVRLLKNKFYYFNYSYLDAFTKLLRS